MAAQDRCRNQLGYIGRLVAAELQLMQSRIPQLFARFVFRVRSAGIPLRSARIEVPAVVVDSLAFLLEFVEQGVRVGQRLAFKMDKTNHYIGHLHSGVVNVVLDIHFLPGGAQQADERVTEDGVAQMAHVGGLVGIDAGMLHQRVDPRRGGSLLGSSG